jgi:hypothetical protein
MHDGNLVGHGCLCALQLFPFIYDEGLHSSLSGKFRVLNCRLILLGAGGECGRIVPPDLINPSLGSQALMGHGGVVAS